MKEHVQKFPSTARIHIPVHWTYGVRIDESMPVGTRWPLPSKRRSDGARLTYPLVLVENPSENAGFLEISSCTIQELTGTDGTGVGFPFWVTNRKPTVSVERTADGFSLTFTSHTEQDVTTRQVSSPDESVGAYHQWLKENYGLRTLDEKIADGLLPPWITDIPVAFIFDMWLANYEVAHNYNHLRDFAGELRKLGVPPGVLFYIPGWCGPYDGRYPEYEPVPELGGLSAFRECCQAVHEAGYHIMVHGLGWGTDPYLPRFERFTSLAVRNWDDPDNPPPPIVHNHQATKPKDGSPVPSAPADDPLRGPYGGWPGGGEWYRLEYDSGKQTIGKSRRSPNGWIFDTVSIPERCEAVITLGGLKSVGAGVVKLTINGRSLVTPAGWFQKHDAYRFPFTFLFFPGTNPIELAYFGGTGNSGGFGEAPKPDLQDSWYRVDEAYGHNLNIWTQPAVAVDTDDPAWHQAYCERLVPTVQEFHVDAVHIDATTLWRWDEKGLCGALKRELPAGTVFGTEVATTPGMTFFSLNQTRTPSPSQRDEMKKALNGWEPEYTDLPWRITREYSRFYPHLCVPRGLVPSGSSCRVDRMPPSLSEEEVDSVYRELKALPDFNIIPTLRVNYRDYGLDERTRKYLLEEIISPLKKGR